MNKLWINEKIQRYGKDRYGRDRINMNANTVSLEDMLWVQNWAAWPHVTTLFTIHEEKIQLFYLFSTLCSVRKGHWIKIRSYMHPSIFKNTFFGVVLSNILNQNKIYRTVVIWRHWMVESVFLFCLSNFNNGAAKSLLRKGHKMSGQKKWDANGRILNLMGLYGAFSDMERMQVICT